MRRFNLWPLALLATSLATPTLAEERDGNWMRLQPSSEWKLRQYDDKCRVSQNFAGPDGSVTLWLDKGGSGPTMNVTLIGNVLRNPYGPRMRVSFAPGEEVSRNYLEAKSSSGRPVISLFGVDPMAGWEEINLVPPEPTAASQSPVEIEGEEVNLSEARVGAGPEHHDYGGRPNLRDDRIEQIDAIQIKGAIAKPISLEMEGLTDALNQLSDCSAALVDQIYANYHSIDGSPRAPLPVKQGEWARKLQEHYPYAMLKAGEQGTVGVRLTINAKGRPSFCEILFYSGPASFNDTVCLQMLRHAQFEPGKNASGEPIVGFFQTRVTYKLN